jgi:predicted dinucleotide-binding enzyme
MKIGVLGTGMVGMAIATRLVELGHEVKMGSRTANNENAASWAKELGLKASHGTFADVAKFGEVIFNCTKGEISLDVVKAAGEENLLGKILVDVANPLDPAHPGSLLFCNRESLGELIQTEFPRAKVVKTLNTMWWGLMANPRMFSDSHNVFVCGNDQEAKSTVMALLKSFGWTQEEIIDLGDITAARTTEMLLPLWLRIWKTTNSATFNFRIIR